MKPPLVSPRREAGLLIVGHGSTVNPDSSAPSYEHANAIRRRGIFGEVACCFWKEEPGFRDAAAGLLFNPRMREVYVVPNFISEGYFTQTVIPRELGLDRDAAGEVAPVTRRTHPAGQLWKYCEPVGNHPAATALLLQRAREAASGVPEGKTSLLVVGHGTSLNDNSAVAAKRQTEAIRAMGLYARVVNCYMEEPPLIADWVSLTDTQNVVVVPFFISDGLHSYQDIPVLLGIETAPGPAASALARQGALFRRNPHRIAGRALYYASAIGTEPRFADLLVEQALAFDERALAVS